MATRDDVARRAGVSPSTVSYVISGQRTISAATRARVEQAMRELSYTPNAFAQGLAGARGKIVALHYPYSSEGLGTTEFEYVAAASDQARRRGYHLLLWSNPIDDVDSLRSLVNQRLVDGVILMEVLSTDPRIDALRESQVPFTTIGRPQDATGVAFVDNDFETLAREAVDHVADLGHREVAFLTQPAGLLERGHGPLVRTLDAIALPAQRRGVRLTQLPAERSLRGGQAAYERLRALDPVPTAVISMNERATPGLLGAAALAGTQVPLHLTVVGLSFSAAAAEMLTPPLTTVSPSARVISAKAMDVLADLIEGKAGGTPQSLVAPVLTVRGTSAAPDR